MAQTHRIATGDEIPHALIVDRLEQHGRGGGPIADSFVQAP